MPGERRRLAATFLVALLLAPTPLLLGRGADEALPPPPSAASLFPAASSGRVLLSRVYANSARDDEFIEIANEGPSSVDLGGWSLTDLEDSATFPAGTGLPVGRRLVATRNATSYMEDVRRQAEFTYDRGEAARMEGRPLHLADGGDEILLLDAAGTMIDAYVYGTSAYAGPGWEGPPAPAAGRGELATRASNAGILEDHDDASDWNGLRAFRLGQSDFRPPPIEVGHEPVAIVSPDDGRGRVLSFLQSAEVSLEVAVYTMTSDAFGAILADAAKRGVRVRVLLESSPVGGVDDHEGCIVTHLLDAGAEVRWLSGGLGVVKRYRYLHAKYAIVDGAAVLVSSENFGDSGFPPAGQRGNRGWSVILEDLGLAGQLWEVFEEDFDPSRGDSLPARQEDGTCLAGSTPAGPWIPPAASGPRRAQLVVGPDAALADDSLLGLLASARDHIWIEAFYADEAWADRPNPFVEAAFAAARRSVSVRMLLDGSGWSTEEDAQANDAVAARLNGRARDEGVDFEARLLLPAGAVERLHNKGVVVDGKTVLVSSMNWARGSATENREIGVIVEDTTLASRFEEAFLRDWDGRLPGRRDDRTIDDPAVLAAMYVFIAAASALSLRKMRRRDKGLKPGPPMNRRGLLRAHLRRGCREVRILPAELVAEPRDGSGGGSGDRGGGDEAPGSLGGLEGD